MWERGRGERKGKLTQDCNTDTGSDPMALRIRGEAVDKCTEWHTNSAAESCVQSSFWTSFRNVFQVKLVAVPIASVPDCTAESLSQIDETTLACKKGIQLDSGNTYSEKETHQC